MIKRNPPTGGTHLGEGLRTFDCAGRSTREINTFLKESARLGPDAQAVLLHPDSRHNLAVGLTSPLAVRIEGHVGYYCGGLCQGVDIQIAGDAGLGPGREPDGGPRRNSPARRVRRRGRPCAAGR